MTVVTQLQPRYPASLAAGVLLLLLAPWLASSAAAFYAGGVTLSFIALSLVILYHVSRRVPGGSKLSGARTSPTLPFDAHLRPRARPRLARV